MKGLIEIGVFTVIVGAAVLFVHHVASSSADVVKGIIEVIGG